MPGDESKRDLDAALALPTEAVDAILAAVAEGAGGRNLLPEGFDRNALAQDLGRAQITYRMLQHEDQEPTAAEQQRHFEKLFDTAKAFQIALMNFEQAGRPGWQVLRRMAEERLSAAYQDLNKLDRQIADQENVLSRMSASKAVVEDMTAVERERQKLRELSAQRGELGRIIIFYDNHRPEGILMTMEKGVDELVGWLASAFDYRSRALRKRDQDPLRVERQEKDFVSAMRWLVAHRLPAIYEQHFRRPVGRSRSDSGRRKGKPDGPAIRFAVAALRAMGVTSPRTGRPLSGAGVEDYWKE